MFKIQRLTAYANDKKILDNFSLDINDGEIHTIMGKNGIGKSTLCKIILNDKNYTIKAGKISYNNKSLLDMDTSDIAKEGIMLINQNPIAIEGVSNAEVLRNALREKTGENINIFKFNKEMEEICEKLALDPKFIHKDVNVGASGGERKKIELLHMGILKPSFLILDEIDSGLDVEALKVVAQFINEYHKQSGCSILLITHHPKIVEYIKPNYVHILSDGQIKKTGDYHLAKEIEDEGFEANIMGEINGNE